MNETKIIAKLSKEAGRNLTAELACAPFDIPTQINTAASQYPKRGTLYWMMRYWAENYQSKAEETYVVKTALRWAQATIKHEEMQAKRPNVSDAEMETAVVEYNAAHEALLNAVALYNMAV